MNFIRQSISIGNQQLYFVCPQNDSTVLGTFNCIQSNKFHLAEMSFKENEVFLDIGCNVGLVSLLAAFLFPQARIFAFDPSPASILCLRKSIALNQFTNLQCFQVAVGDRSQKNVSFFSNGQDVSCLVQQGLNNSNPIFDSVSNIIAIDEIFDSSLLGIDRVHYLKMDIEGGEFAIFKHLFGKRPDILDRIDLLHLEIHNYKELGPAELKAQVVAKFGNRVCFDT